MTTEIQTKRRWLQSVLKSVDETMPTRVFPREIRQAIQLRPQPKGLALRLKTVTRAASAAN